MLAAATPALITFAKLNNFDCLQIDLKNTGSSCIATNYEIHPAVATSSGTLKLNIVERNFFSYSKENSWQTCPMDFLREKIKFFPENCGLDCPWCDHGLDGRWESISSQLRNMDTWGHPQVEEGSWPTLFLDTSEAIQNIIIWKLVFMIFTRLERCLKGKEYRYF